MNLLQIFIKSDFREHFHLGMQQCWKRWWDGHLFMFFQRNWFKDIFLMGTKTTNFRAQFTKQHTADIAFNENIIGRPWYTPRNIRRTKKTNIWEMTFHCLVDRFTQFQSLRSVPVSPVNQIHLKMEKKGLIEIANLDWIKEKIRFINGHVLSCVFSR